MLKLLKWDFLNFIKRYYWLYISLAVTYAVACFFPEIHRLASTAADGVCAIFSVLFYIYTLFISATETISWLRKESSQLELSLSVKPWEILLSKLILSICINITGLVFTKLLWSQIERFGMSKIVFFNSLTGFIQYMICILTLITIIMFSYISAKSCGFTRNKAGITTVVLTISIPVLLIWIVSIFFIAAGAWDVTVTTYGEFSLLANGKLTWLQTICGITCPAAIVAAGFSGSCALLRHKFERY